MLSYPNVRGEPEDFRTRNQGAGISGRWRSHALFAGETSVEAGGGEEGKRAMDPDVYYLRTSRSCWSPPGTVRVPVLHGGSGPRRAHPGLWGTLEHVDCRVHTEDEMVETLWEFIRGDMDASQFEQWAYVCLRCLRRFQGRYREHPYV
jgi:hypothetical protein